MGTQSVASPCCGNRSDLPVVRLGLLLATVAFVPGALLAQLTTGAIEGTLRATDGRPVTGTPILVTGGAGFRTVIHSNSNGRFAMTLPYGRYRLSGDVQHSAESSATTVFVAPLQTTRFDLLMDASGSIRGVQPVARTPIGRATTHAVPDHLPLCSVPSRRRLPPRIAAGEPLWLSVDSSRSAHLFAG